MSLNIQPEYSIFVSQGNNTSYVEQMNISSLRRQYLHCSQSRCLQLKFMNNIIGPVYTGLPIQGERGTLKVALIDVFSGDVVKSGPEASAKLELVALDKNFNFTEEEDWSFEDFNSKVIVGRDGKSSLLRGDPYVYLKDGVGYVNDISFRHSRCWFRKLNCRFGARVVDHFNGVRIREAKTETFFVIDRRGMIKKHKPLRLTDEVTRLERIGKNGRLHNRLREENILTVKNFLTEFYLNRERLQLILEACVSGKKWEATVCHALTCKLDETRCLYICPSFEPKVGVVFNIVGKLIGLLLVDRYVPGEEISAFDKIKGCQLVMSAFQNWNNVKKYPNENSLMHYLSILGVTFNPSESMTVDSSIQWSADTGVMNEKNRVPGFITSSQGSVSNAANANANPSSDYYSPLSLDHESAQLMDHILELVDAENTRHDTDDQGSRVTQNGRNNLQSVAAASIDKVRRWWKKVFHVLRWLFQLKKRFQFRRCNKGEDAEILLPW